MGQNCKPYMVLWYLLSIHSYSNPNADILVTSLVLKHCAHALCQPRGCYFNCQVLDLTWIWPETPMRHLRSPSDVTSDLTWPENNLTVCQKLIINLPPKTPQKRPKRAFLESFGALLGVLGRFLGVFGRLMRVQKMRSLFFDLTWIWPERTGGHGKITDWPDLTCWPEIHCFWSGQVNFIWKSHLSLGPWKSKLSPHPLP